MACMGLAAGVKAVNAVLKAGKVCDAFGNLPGFNVACGSREFMHLLHKKMLCELFCCCKDAGKQACVDKVLKEADADGSSYYKQPTHDIDNNPTQQSSSGSRKPDVVTVKEPGFLSFLSNIEDVFEMKFPGDRYRSKVGGDGMSQLESYKQRYGKKFEGGDINVDTCDCNNDGGGGGTPLLDKAKDFQFFVLDAPPPRLVPYPVNPSPRPGMPPPIALPGWLLLLMVL